MRYLLVVEQGPTPFGANAPDLPRLRRGRRDKSEALKPIRETIEIHTSDPKNEGREVPEATSVSEVAVVETA